MVITVDHRPHQITDWLLALGEKPTCEIGPFPVQLSSFHAYAGNDHVAVSRKGKMKNRAGNQGRFASIPKKNQ